MLMFVEERLGGYTLKMEKKKKQTVERTVMYSSTQDYVMAIVHQRIERLKDQKHKLWKRTE